MPPATRTDRGRAPGDELKERQAVPATPPQPRRTVAIILLDRVVALVTAARRVLTGREDVSRATWVAVVAALGVLIATAVSVVGVLRTPEKLTPVTLDPPPSVEQVGASPSGYPPGAGTTGGHQPGGARSPPPASASAVPTGRRCVDPAHADRCDSRAHPGGPGRRLRHHGQRPAQLRRGSDDQQSRLGPGAGVDACRHPAPGVAGGQRGRGGAGQPGRCGVDVRAGPEAPVRCPATPRSG